MIHGFITCQRVGVSHCHCHCIFGPAAQTLATHQFLGRGLASVSISPEVCNLNLTWPEAWLVVFDWWRMTNPMDSGLWTAKDYGINALCTMDLMMIGIWYDMYGPYGHVWTHVTHTGTGNWRSWVYTCRHQFDFACAFGCLCRIWSCNVTQPF